MRAFLRLLCGGTCHDDEGLQNMEDCVKAAYGANDASSAKKRKCQRFTNRFTYFSLTQLTLSLPYGGDPVLSFSSKQNPHLSLHKTLTGLSFSNSMPRTKQL